MSHYEQMVARYASGRLPWDDVAPPPEAMDLIAGLPPGRALDLGCGYGRSSIYLAQRGWRVDGVDFVPQAVAEAKRRAQLAGVAANIQFHQASVADLSFLTGSYDFALDVGCMHALDAVELAAYAAGLRRLLRPGAAYLLFVRLQPSDIEPENGPRGISEPVIRRLFAERFSLERVERGETLVEDQPVWASAWFYFYRQSA